MAIPLHRFQQKNYRDTLVFEEEYRLIFIAKANVDADGAAGKSWS